MLEDEPSPLVEHARRELALLGEDPEVSAALVRAVEGFVTYRHSGGSASVAQDLLDRLLGYEALTPLSSDPAEWEDRSAVSGSPMWQNRRDSRAISQDAGATWWYVEARHPGERCKEDGQWGTLVRCPQCEGDGLLHRPDTGPEPGPEPTAEPLQAVAGVIGTLGRALRRDRHPPKGS